MNLFADIRDLTLTALDALEAEGGEARVAGGAVRDGLLGLPVNDVDIATTEPPERIIELAENAGLRAHPTGLQHGTVTVVSNHLARSNAPAPAPHPRSTMRGVSGNSGSSDKICSENDGSPGPWRLRPRCNSINASMCSSCSAMFISLSDRFEGYDALLRFS